MQDSTSIPYLDQSDIIRDITETLKSHNLSRGQGLYISDGHMITRLYSEQDLTNITMNNPEQYNYHQELYDIESNTIDYAIAVQAFTGTVHDVFEWFESLTRVLHIGSILYVCANKSTPKLFNSDKVVERDPRGGFTILDNNAHTHYFTEYELELHLSEFDIERMRPIYLIKDDTSYPQWEIIASR